MKEREEITEEAVRITVKRALSYLSSIQAHDGHWPAELAGGLFFMPPLVRILFLFSFTYQNATIMYIYTHT